MIRSVTPEREILIEEDDGKAYFLTDNDTNFKVGNRYENSLFTTWNWDATVRPYLSLGR